MKQQLSQYPLLRALIERRSRRFGKGMCLNGGPLAYASAYDPQLLDIDDEAALVFAACGITGTTMAELPYGSGDVLDASSGNIIANFIGRTVPSGDAMHTVTLFVLNDNGAWMIKRPQDYQREEILSLARDARDGKLTELYQTSRLRIRERRPEIPCEPPYTPPFNKWSANVPGSTYFLPVNELSALYINILLSAFDHELAYFIVDEKNRFRPAGIGRFARSRGGHLHDDPARGRVATVGFVETWLYEFAAIEQGAMLQNLALMTEALGLGGFPHFAAHPFIWLQQLGFRMESIPFTPTIEAGLLAKLALKALARDLPIPTAVGLEVNNHALIRPYCPPYYRDMKEAVLAYVDYKYGNKAGIFRDGGAATSWKDGASIQAEIPEYSDRAIAATIAYCQYLHGRYGRFPVGCGPFRTILAHQAHHLDPDFYDTFYRPEALGGLAHELG